MLVSAIFLLPVWIISIELGIRKNPLAELLSIMASILAMIFFLSWFMSSINAIFFRKWKTRIPGTIQAEALAFFGLFHLSFLLKSFYLS